MLSRKRQLIKTLTAKVKRKKTARRLQTGGIIGLQRPFALTYVQEATVDGAAAGAATTVVFRLNGMYDPDYTGVGHQPLGFDQMMGLYYKYIVTGCRYEVIISSTNVTATNTCVVGVSIQNAVTTSIAWTEYAEQPGTKFQLLEGRGGNVTRVKFIGYVDIAKNHGRTRGNILGEDDFQGTASTNPAQTVNLLIWAAGWGGQNPDACAATVKLTYYGVFRDPRLVGQS